MIEVLNILLEIAKLIKKYGLRALVLFLLVVLFYIVVCFFSILLDEDKSDLWRGKVYKFLYKLTKKRDAEKKYIANDVAGRVNLARKQMPFGKESIPKALRVEWIDSGQVESYVPKEGELVVKLESAETQEKNITSLAQALVSRTALVGIRYIISKPLENAIDLNLIKKLLSEIKNRAILDWYMRNEYMPKIVQNKNLKEWNSKIVEIDERGLFTRLLLVELDSYGKKIAGRLKTTEMESEIENLIEFLYKIANKTYGVDAPLDYITRNVKIGVLIVGETSKILSYGIEPYVHAFICKLNKKIEAIYVLSFSKEFLGEHDEKNSKAFGEIQTFLQQKIEQDFKVERDFELAYSCIDVNGRERKAKCIRYIPIY